MVQYRKGQQLFQSGFHPKLITLLIYKHNNMVILYNDMAWEVVLIFVTQSTIYGWPTCTTWHAGV